MGIPPWVAGDMASELSLRSSLRTRFGCGVRTLASLEPADVVWVWRPNSRFARACGRPSGATTRQGGLVGQGGARFLVAPLPGGTSPDDASDAGEKNVGTGCARSFFRGRRRCRWTKPTSTAEGEPAAAPGAGG